jgi:hypothetical protein
VPHRDPIKNGERVSKATDRRATEEDGDATLCLLTSKRAHRWVDAPSASGFMAVSFLVRVPATMSRASIDDDSFPYGSGAPTRRLFERTTTSAISHTVTMIHGQRRRTDKAIARACDDSYSTSTHTVEHIHVWRWWSPRNKLEVSPL